jgi:predicted CopG family antitoxin
MPTTITVSEETKELLARLKGEKTWDELLLELVENYRREKVKRALEELRKIEFDSSYEEVKLKLRLEGS